VRLSKEKEFDELLADVTQASEEAFELQHYPFERLVRLLNPARESNRQPLINIVYSFQNFGNVRVGDSGSEGSAAPVRIGDFPLDFAVSKFDLTFIVSQDEEGLSMAIEYDTGLFRAATIERCALNIGRFAASIAEASAK
jgi:non-ribosomal peptide synthetase component F